MIFGPKWPKFHGDSFPDVKRSKFLYIWWVLMIFVNFWYKKTLLFFKGQKSEKLLASQQRLAPPRPRYHMVPYGHATFCSHTLRLGGWAICSHTCSHTHFLIPWDWTPVPILGSRTLAGSHSVLIVFPYLCAFLGPKALSWCSHTRFSYLCWGMRTNGPPPRTAENVARPYGTIWYLMVP